MNKEENSENMIEIKNLRKDYKMYKSKKARLLEAVLPFYQNHGTFSAINDLDLTLKKGEVLGILGKNGAGKSTTIRMMCTLFSPTDGEIWIGGQQVGVHDEEIRQKIGVVWQENVLDDRLTVKENLQVRAAMYQTKSSWQKERIQTVCEKLHLEDIYTRRYMKLSGDKRGDVRLRQHC